MNAIGLSNFGLLEETEDTLLSHHNNDDVGVEARLYRSIQKVFFSASEFFYSVKIFFCFNLGPHLRCHDPLPFVNQFALGASATAIRALLLVATQARYYAVIAATRTFGNACD